MPSGQYQRPAESTELSAAFNAGCEARLAGLPKEACPFVHQDHNGRFWLQGWNDVNRYFGVDAFHEHRALPAIVEAA